MLGLMVMAVDFGRFYAIQAELQTANDAAALAAATRLAGTMSSADQADLEWNASFDSTSGNDNRFNLRLNQVLLVEICLPKRQPLTYPVWQTPSGTQEAKPEAST